MGVDAGPFKTDVFAFVLKFSGKPRGISDTLRKCDQLLYNIPS
jgi:hypothetical protein